MFNLNYHKFSIKSYVLDVYKNRLGEGGVGSGGCKPRIESIVKWGWGFSQGDQSVCVNEGLKGCRSGVGSGWL